MLGNFNAAMQDAAAGSIPVYAGDEAWEIEKLITKFNENTPLSGYIPDTAWVAAYMEAQKALLKLLPDSAAADDGKLLQVGADGAAAWGDKLPTALKNPKALTFTGAATGTYDGSEALTITIPEGGSGGSTGGGLRKMSAVASYIGIPVAELPQDGTVWMCISKGDGAELYSGTVTIEGGSLTANNLIAVSSGSVIQLNQATTIGAGFVIYGMSATDYVGVWQEVGAGGASINWRGEWAETTKYSKLDAVSYEGSSYIFASDTPAIGAIPGIDGEWQLMAQGGGSGGSTGGGLRKMSAVASYIGIPVAELPQDGTVWMCISKGDGAELYSGTVTIEGGSLTANNLIAVSSGSVIQLNQATTIGAGFVIYGMSATDYVGVWQEVGAGGASINWRGEWAETTKYSKLDAVSYEGSSYIFASDTPAIGAIPGIDGEWQLMAQGGGSGTDLSLGVTGATVGKIAKITAVDASGVPTAWEPVDMPSGGDESDFEKVVEMTTPGDAAVISISTDKNGNPLSMSEFYVAITTARNNAATANNHFNCNVLPDTVHSHIRAASAITNITLFQDVYCYVMHYKLIGRMIFNECAGRQRTASGLNVAEYIENEKSIHISAVVSEGTIGFLSPTDARTGESKVNSAGKMYCITFDANSTDCIFGAGTRVEVWAR